MFAPFIHFGMRFWIGIFNCHVYVFIEWNAISLAQWLWISIYTIYLIYLILRVTLVIFTLCSIYILYVYIIYKDAIVIIVIGHLFWCYFYWVMLKMHIVCLIIGKHGTNEAVVAQPSSYVICLEDWYWTVLPISIRHALLVLGASGTHTDWLERVLLRPDILRGR